MIQEQITLIANTGGKIWDDLPESTRDNFMYDTGLIGFVESVMELLHIDLDLLTDETYTEIARLIWPAEEPPSKLAKIVKKLSTLPHNACFHGLFSLFDWLHEVEVTSKDKVVSFNVDGLSFHIYNTTIAIEDLRTGKLLCRVSVDLEPKWRFK